MAFNQYPIDYSSYQNVRCIASDCPPLTIVPRDLNGVPGPQYQNGDAEHINTAIDIFRTKLKDQKVRDSFKTVAYQYRSRVPNGWFTQDSPLPSLEKVTDDFINQICSVSFPIVFVDYAWENPDYQGFHTRRPWDGKFEPGHQAISINGKMVDEMNAAFLTAFVDENMGRLFRAFQFKTVNTLLHGMCDVFFTYLTRGQRLTPTEINALTVGVPTPNGEAGRALESMIFGALESLIFGGTMHYFQDLASRNPVDSCGTAYLKKANGAYYRVPQSTIDYTVIPASTFPYKHDGKPTDIQQLRSLGEGLGPPTYTDPLDRDDVAHLLRPPPAYI